MVVTVADGGARVAAEYYSGLRVDAAELRPPQGEFRALADQFVGEHVRQAAYVNAARLALSQQHRNRSKLIWGGPIDL